MSPVDIDGTPIEALCGASRVVHVGKDVDLEVLCGFVAGRDHHKHVASSVLDEVAVVFIWDVEPVTK